MLCPFQRCLSKLQLWYSSGNSFWNISSSYISTYHPSSWFPQQWLIEWNQSVSSVSEIMCSRCILTKTEALKVNTRYNEFIPHTDLWYSHCYNLFLLSVPGIRTHSFPWCCKATFQQNEEPVCQHLPMYVFDLLYVVNMHACPCFHCKLNHTLCLTATAYDDIIFFAYRIFILMKTYYINLQFTILRLHNSLLPL